MTLDVVDAHVLLEAVQRQPYNGASREVDSLQEACDADLLEKVALRIGDVDRDRLDRRAGLFDGLLLR